MVLFLALNQAFRLHPASIAAMAECALSLFILVYFLSLRNKTKDTWLMIGYAGLLLLVFIADVGVTSSREGFYPYFRMIHTLLFSLWTLFGIWCAYTYKDKPLTQEAIIVMILSGILLGVILADLFVPGLILVQKSIDLTFVYILMGIQFWSMLVMLRRTVIASKRQQPTPGTISYHLLHPTGASAQSLQVFALLLFWWNSFVFTSLMSGSPLSYHLGQMFLLLGVLIIHLNYASETVTFQVKLVSLPLTTILALLGILPFLLFGDTAPEATWNLIDNRLQDQLHIFAWLIPGCSIFILVSFFLFYWLGLLKPLKKLLAGVHHFEAGDLQARVSISSQDEIGYLAQSLNRMAASLKASSDQLEERVEVRTAELQASLQKLQATQTQLIQSEKMASLGELTAGIAHEIQNPLNFVNNFSEVSQELCSELEQETKVGQREEVLAIAADLKQNLEKIYHHGKRADAIVKSMLQHSRSSSGEKQLTDINTLADEYLRLAYHGLRAKDKDFNAEFTLEADSAMEKIEVVPQEIGRVMLNLFNNAFYATAQKKCQRNGQYMPQVAVTTKRLVDSVEIRVKDNGMGIPETIKSKIFQPFFTTKPTGEGTGLGLSLSYNIISKGHGGELRVESKEGEGSEFIIRLPVSN